MNKITSAVALLAVKQLAKSFELARADFVRADADFKESDHPRAENGQFGSGSGVTPSKLSDSDTKSLAKFRKSESSIKEKIKSGEQLNSNEKYLIENRKQLEEKFGEKFDFPSEVKEKYESQKKETEKIKQEENNKLEASRRKAKEEQEKQRIQRESQQVENIKSLSDAIQKGDYEKAASEALKRAESLGYWDNGDYILDVNNNESPVPYRAGAAMALLSKNGWETDEPPIKGSDESFYITAKKGSNTIKVRIANHGNTTSLHEKPWINISPNENTISDIEELLKDADKKKNLSVDW